MEEVGLNEVLEIIGQSAIDKQRSDGSFPSGNNGPHGDSETPVRNTSHFVLLFAQLFEETNNELYRRSAIDGFEYLSRSEVRPYGVTFHHRNNEKDCCNGIVGQAWTIEALAEMATVLDMDEPVDIAEEVFLLHPFDYNLGLWKRVEIDGDILCFDSTLNHQIWFAAAGGLLTKHHDVDSEINRQVIRFLDRLDELVDVSEEGLIKGGSLSFLEYPYALRSDNRGRIVFVDIAMKLPVFESNFVRDSILKFTPLSRLPPTNADKREKAIGYHSFHLYGLALLKSAYPDHAIWTSDWIQQALEYAESPSFISELGESIMGYPYNISGVEMAFVHDVFGTGNRDVQRRWLQRQFDHTWDSEDEMLSRNTPDPRTLTARLYEATRLSDYDFEIELPDTSETS